jgi:hypothetical protein
MEKKAVNLKKDGSIVGGDLFEERDFIKIKEIFKLWMEVNKHIRSLNGRAINIPEILSEGIYAYLFEAVRTNNTAYSYDCVDIKSGEGIQVKATSIQDDLTSFGPKSTWDKLIFMDFAPNGYIDGNIDIYHIPDEKLYTIVLNKAKKETFMDQQLAGKRPRLSIRNQFIIPMGLKPILSVNLLEE